MNPTFGVRAHSAGTFGATPGRAGSFVQGGRAGADRLDVDRAYADLISQTSEKQVQQVRVGGAKAELDVVLSALYLRRQAFERQSAAARHREDGFERAESVAGVDIETKEEVWRVHAIKDNAGGAE
jgi:hypothetical protein